MSGEPNNYGRIRAALQSVPSPPPPIEHRPAGTGYLRIFALHLLDLPRRATDRRHPSKCQRPALPAQRTGEDKSNLASFPPTRAVNRLRCVSEPATSLGDRLNQPLRARASHESKHFVAGSVRRSRKDAGQSKHLERLVQFTVPVDVDGDRARFHTDERHLCVVGAFGRRRVVTRARLAARFWRVAVSGAAVLLIVTAAATWSGLLPLAPPAATATAGRLELVGSGYRLTASVENLDGTTVASNTEEVVDQDDVLSVMRRQSTWLRAELGEALTGRHTLLAGAPAIWPGLCTVASVEGNFGVYPGFPKTFC